MALDAMLDRGTVDRITAEAREVRIGFTILTILAAFFFAIGWTAAKVLGGIWLALAWSATAIKVGWQEARRSREVSRA